MAFFTAKVPVALATGVICLALGGGLGALIMSYALGKPDQAAAGTTAKGDEEGKADPKAAGGDAKGKGGGVAVTRAAVGTREVAVAAGVSAARRVRRRNSRNSLRSSTCLPGSRSTSI